MDLSNKSLSELIEVLGESRNETIAAETALKALKSRDSGIRQALEAKLREEGLKSAKGTDFQAVLTETPQFVVTDERAAIEWINTAPDVETDFYIGIKSVPFQNLAKYVFKETGDMIPGTEVRTRESLAIRSNKKEKKSADA